MAGEERWVGVDDVAAHLGVAKDSIYRWIEERGFPVHRVGRLFRFKLSEIDEWVNPGGISRQVSLDEKTGQKSAKKQKVKDTAKESVRNSATPPPQTVLSDETQRNCTDFDERVDALLEYNSGSDGENPTGALIETPVRSRNDQALGAGLRQGPESENYLLRKSLQFEVLISELSRRFINMPAHKIDAEIETCQRRVCQSLGLNGSTVSEFSSDMETLTPTHVWRAEGISDPVPVVVKKWVPYFIDRLKRGEIMVFSSSEEFPESEGNLKLLVERMGLTSAVGIPFEIGGEIIGGISWESHGTNVKWPADLVNRLRLVSEIFASALSRKRSEENLQKSLIEIKDLKDRLQGEVLYLRDEIKIEHRHPRIVGQSNSIMEVLRRVEQVGSTQSSVLIRGETGTGKDLVAQAIHNLSSRRERPMVKINCASLPPTLIESELFGHEKGAYSGAVRTRLGRFEVADGSTIFLDEISELPMELQSKLLTVLQEGRFERLGSSKPRTVDVRVIAATNCDLPQAIQEKKFRKDLYFRLNVFPITVPPLRDRVEDIPALVRAFVEEFSGPMGKSIDAISNSSMEALKHHNWPGNVRELRNVVERAMIICPKGGVLHIETPAPETVNMGTPCIKPMDEMQREYILNVLEKTDGRIYGAGGAAELLVMNPDTLRSRMKRLGISHAKYLP